MIDMDDLSSGEKSVIQMFYPLLERRIKAILRKLRDEQGTPQPQPEECLLIDEPELHLHPNLQLKVLDYMRLLASESRTQVIVTTQSPTIVEHATFEELFVLRPVELVPAGDNQLVQVATNEERLRHLRELFGNTSTLTSLQPIVVVEGVEQVSDFRYPSDRKLYRALHPSFDRVTLLPGGGKGECIKLTEALNAALAELSATLYAVALLDKDMSLNAPFPSIKYLPVSMIENFLLDPDAIWEAIQSIVERTGFKTVDDVAQAIDGVMDNLEDQEIERRALLTLGTATFRPQSPVGAISKQFASFLENATAQFGEEKSTEHVPERRKSWHRSNKVS
ncbi:MAG: AAA family ATPase [Chloroflexi bacterium]|nr:AAA family ATPase [Chloroflexota bacterium]